MPEPQPAKSETNVGDVLELVKGYVRQETIGPLRGAGRWVAFGAAGALCLGIGIFFLVLGLLRLLQTETADTFDGNLSILPYLFALVFCGAVVGFAFTRIKKTSLHKESR